MTHMGQEFTLGAIRPLCFLNCPLQTFLLLLLLRYDVFDVHTAFEYRPHLLIHIGITDHFTPH